MANTHGDTGVAAVGALDTAFLERLPGYLARRAAAAIIVHFGRHLKGMDLRPAEFAALSLIGHNPGITARQLCGELDMAPPNVAKIIKGFEGRNLIERSQHPTDGRAVGLELTRAGTTLLARAEPAALAADRAGTAALTTREEATLRRLLRKVYQGR